jgi:predicted permease
VLSNLHQDILSACRLLARNAGFSLLIVITLALAIGGNVAIFSIVQAAILSPLPYPESNQLAQITRYSSSGREYDLQSDAKLLFLHDNSSAFSSVAAFDAQPSGLNLTADGSSSFIQALGVSADFFRMLGVTPTVGRTFAPGEDRSNAEHVVVISQDLWKQRFASDPAIVGQSVNLSGELYTIIGVMPAGFKAIPQASIWLPLRLAPESNANKYNLLARLKPGVTLSQAQAEVDREWRVLRQQKPNVLAEGEEARVLPYRQHLVGDVRTPLLVLLGAVAMVLLIACANVTNLLLAKASARAHEVALRTALGASRWRIARQMFTESAFLAAAGALSGLLLAGWLLPILLSAAPRQLLLIGAVRMNMAVLLYTAGLALSVLVLFGLAPALHASRANVNMAIREAGNKGSAGRQRLRLIEIFVAVEVASCVTLLAGATLFMHTFINLRSVNPGFDAKGVLVGHMSLRGPEYTSSEKLVHLYDPGIRAIKTIPGVEDAAIISSLPFERGLNLPFDLLDGTGDPKAQLCDWRYITAGYFQVMRIRLVSGRAFTDADSGSSSGVIIINEAFAKTYFPHASPIGRYIRLGRFGASNLEDRAREIIGVSADVHQAGLDAPAPPTAYVPASQVPANVLTLTHNLSLVSWVVRLRPGVNATDAIQAQIRNIDPRQPFAGFQPLGAFLTYSISRQKFNMLVVASFAALALVLALMGLHGVMAFSVSARTREIGIRLAMGALRKDILRLILGQGGRLVLIGTVAGILITLALSRIASSMLFGISASDPATLVLVVFIIAAFSLLACYIPARDAIKVDPLLALKHE